jgi:hypothetical protein
MIVGEDVVIINREELENEDVQKRLVNVLPKKKRLVVKEGERRATIINLDQVTFLEIHEEIISAEFPNKADIFITPKEIRPVYPENDRYGV